VTGKSERASLLSPAFLRVTVANFCFFMTFASFFLLPLQVRALGGSERTVGFVMGMNGIAGLVSVFALGPVLDRWGRLLFLRVGLAIMLLATLGYLLVDRIGPLLFALRIVQGVAFAAGFNAASTLAAELAPADRRAAALGVFGVSTLGTHALAPTIGEQLIRIGGFQLLFLVAAGYSVIGLVLTLGIPAVDPHRHARPAPVLFPPGFLATMAVVALAGIAFGTVVTFMPTFVHHEAGFGSVSVFFLTYTAAAIGTRFVGAGLGDRIGHRRVIVPALAGLGLSIAAIATVHSVPALALVAVAFGVAQGIVYPTLNAFTIEHVASGQLGRVQTLFNGSFNLGVTTGSFALGGVADAYGHRTAFVCAGVTALLATALFSMTTEDARAAAMRRSTLDSDASASG
jgi:MFS family permease